jgi:cytochrome c oxidase subunit 4
MADHAHPAPDADLEADIHEHHAPGGLMKYLAVFVALLVLTAISFAVGSSQSLRENSPTVMMATMMAVSCAKAMLVILFFMHLMWEANWKYVLTIPASLMSMFLLLMLIPDIGRRVEKYAEERWQFAPTPQAHDAHAHAHDAHAPAAGAHGDDHDHPPGADGAGHAEPKAGKTH